MRRFKLRLILGILFFLFSASLSRAQTCNNVFGITESLEFEIAQSARRLAEQTSFFSEETLYDIFDRHPSQLHSVLLRWYPESAKESVERIHHSIGLDYEVLLLDPGIVNNLDIFILFAREYLSKERPRPTPYQLRQAFSNSLGTETVYRGIVISNEDLLQIRVHGLTSVARLSSVDDRVREANQLFALSGSVPTSKAFSAINFAMDSPRNFIRQHIRARTGSSFLSTSQYPEIAAEVARIYGLKPMRDKEYRTFVFALSIPKIEVLELTRKFSPDELWGQGPLVKDPFGNSFKGHRDTLIETSSGFRINSENIGVEKLIPARIPRKWIVNAFEVRADRLLESFEF